MLPFLTEIIIFNQNVWPQIGHGRNIFFYAHTLQRDYIETPLENPGYVSALESSQYN